MNRSLPTRKLRPHPDLDQLKRQAKELLAAFRAGSGEAAAEIDAHYRRADAPSFVLHDAQLVLARAYGFESWPKLKAYVNGVTVDRLVEAVRAGDLQQVCGMLQARPELARMDMAEDDEHQAMHHAVLARQPEIVRVLLQHGADAQKGIYPHRDATSPLRLAAERGLDDIVTIIREEEQCRPRKASEDLSSNPFPMDLLRGGDEDAVIAVLKANPALVKTPFDRMAPLDVAASMLWERVVVWLLEHGAEMTPPAAVVLGAVEWLRAQHAAGKVENPVGPEGGLLSLAVRRGRADILRLLLELGFDPDERSRVEGLEEIVYSGGGPLHACAASGSLAMAEMLLEHGANPNLHVYASGPPLYRAYQTGDAAMVALLEKSGAVTDASTAGVMRLIDKARQLLADEAAGRLPEGTHYPGWQLAEELLFYACDGGEPEIVRMALERIDWSPEDPRWHGMLVRNLGDHPEPDRRRHIACFRQVLERADPGVAGKHGRTILHDLAANWPHPGPSPEGRVEMAALVLDRRARLDVRDYLLRSTPLGWACRWGRTELVRLLLDRGADPDEKDAEPWATPRAWAEKKGHHDVLDLLKARGA